MTDAVRGMLIALFLTTLAACGDSQPSTALSGEQLYQRHCAACHGNQGSGVPRVFPPLADSEWLNLPDQRLVELVLRGLSGRLQVQGETYEGHMPPQRHLDDHAIARILTYVRQQWGEQSMSPIDEGFVATVRMTADLSQPIKAGDLTPVVQAQSEDAGDEPLGRGGKSEKGVTGEY